VKLSPGSRRPATRAAVGDATRFTGLVDVEQAVVGGHVEGAVPRVDTQTVDMPDGSIVACRGTEGPCSSGCTSHEE